MKIGVTTNLKSFGPPVAEFAKAVEAFGFESLWMGEHPAIPVDVESEFLNGGEVPVSYRHMPSPLIWLTAAAVATTRLKIGTNVCLVPHRNPIHLAKEIACLDYLSGGRFLFGVGAGWLREELAIMGVAYEERWAQTVEYIAAMKTLWTDEEPSFAGRHVSFSKIYCYPKPVQKPHPPIILGAGGGGGRKNGAVLRRVAAMGDGWQPAYLQPAEMAVHLNRLRKLCDDEGRDFDRLEIGLIVPAVHLGVGEAYASLGKRDATAGNAQELLAAYGAAGVKRILVGFADPGPDDYQEKLARAARELGLTPAV